MKYYILILYILFGYAAKAAYPLNTPFVISGVAQGTIYEIKYYAEKEVVKKKDIDSVFRVIDESMSLYLKTSLISTFNSPETQSVVLDKHMQNVVKASLYYNKLTNGYFDVTIFPLLKIWGFGPEGFRNNPSKSQLDSIRKFVGINKISLKGKKLKKNNDKVSIDLNGIAQGYSVDVLSNILRDKGIKSFIVEVGGEIYCQGQKPNGDSYKVAIQRPYSDRSASYKVILKDKAITTSGSYEKYRMVDGKPISHHINPFTGKPITSNTISATVIANSAMEADALDNYLMYLAPQEAISFIERLPHVEAYIIYSENNTLKELQSSGFNNYIYKQH